MTILGEKICSGSFMLLIAKHETITQKYRFFIFSVLNYTKTSKHTFDFFA